MDESIADEEGEPQSRQPRANVMLSATVRRDDGELTTHRVRDLSRGGVRIDGPGTLVTGQIVMVTMGLLEAAGATVVWTDSNFAGLSFFHEIDLEAACARVATFAQIRRPEIKPTTVAAPQAGWIAALRNPYR